MAGSPKTIETVDERKVALAPLLKILECCVCLEVVKIPFKECNRGHLICSECMKSLAKSNCPTCKAAVFQENPVRIKNLLEALLKSCRYSDRGCIRFIEPKTDHESFCEYRDVKCVIDKCQVITLATQLKRHLQIEHEHIRILESSNGSLKIEQFHPNGVVLFVSSLMLSPIKISHTPIFALDTLFWLKTTLDRINGYLELHFSAVFVGCPVFDYFIDLKFDMYNTGMLYSLKASTGTLLRDEENGSAVKVLNSSLKRFIDSDGNLVFTYRIYTKQSNHK